MKLVATVFVRTVLVLFACAPAIYAQAIVRTDLALAINETTGFGGDLPWTVTATSNFIRDVTRVASPSGEVFDADRFGRIDETRAFESLEQALEFVAGDWSITRDDSILPGISPPELVTRTFSVESIAPESINRNRPIVTSPHRGAIVGNGQPFLVA